jgi:hypothetical protein
MQNLSSFCLSFVKLFFCGEPKTLFSCNNNVLYFSQFDIKMVGLLCRQSVNVDKGLFEQRSERFA